MRRRQFITLLGGAAAAWPLAARAQQGERMRRVGFWAGEPETDPNARRRVAAFKQGLAELGWIEGRTVQIEYRWAIIDGERVRADAESLIAVAPDVIVTTGAPTVALFKRLTRTIPIVFTFVTDPVRDGLVETLAHPGGNITGFTIFEHTMAGKWVEMLKEVAPGITRVAVMQNPDHPAWTTYLSAITGVAPTAGVAVTPHPVHDADEIRHAIADFARAPNGGLIVLPSGVAAFYRDVIVARQGDIDCLRSSLSASLSRAGGSSLTEWCFPKCTGRLRAMPIASSGVPSRASYQSRRRPNSNWSSTSRQRARSALTCRRRCSPAPMR